MTYDQYWHGNVWMARAFLQAENMRRSRQAEETNRTAHLQGLYVYEAVGRLAPILHAFAKKGAKPMPYLKEPFDFNEETQEKKEEREKAEALRAEVYMMNMVRAGKGWGK